MEATIRNRVSTENRIHAKPAKRETAKPERRVCGKLYSRRAVITTTRAVVEAIEAIDNGRYIVYTETR